MGPSPINLFNNLSHSSFNIFFHGLDSSGKTSLLYYFKFNQKLPTISTVGFNVQQIHLTNKIYVKIWDIGGGDRWKELIKHYSQQNCDAIVWVIDSIDKKRIKQTSNWFRKVIRNLKFNKNVPVLILMNKQDLKCQNFQLISTDVIIQEFQLNKLAEKRIVWRIIKCSAETGQGINQTLNWLKSHFTNLKK